MRLIKNTRIRRIGDIKTCHHFYLFIYLFICFLIFTIFQDTVPRKKNLNLLPPWEHDRHFRRAHADNPSLRSRAGVLIFRGVRISSLPSSACSTENNSPFPRLNKSRCTFQILDGWPWPQVNPSIITRSAWNTEKLPIFTFCGGGECKTSTSISLFRTWTIWNKLDKVWSSADLLLSVVS